MPNPFGGSAKEWRALLLAAVTFLLVIVVSYMCVQVFKSYKNNSSPEEFAGGASPWITSRSWPTAVLGETTGPVPSVDRERRRRPPAAFGEGTGPVPSVDHPY